MIKPFKTTLLDQHLRKKRITILEANLRMRQKLVDVIYDKITKRQKGYANDRIILESLAFQLHNLYCAFECLFGIVADHFENRFLDETVRNKKLLNRMKMNIAGIRPSFISEPAFVLLTELCNFRRFFRHEYQIKLEPAQIKIVLQKALALKKIYKKDVATFLARLRATTKR